MDALVSEFKKKKKLNKGKFSPHTCSQPNETNFHIIPSDIPLFHDIEFFRRLRPSPVG